MPERVQNLLCTVAKLTNKLLHGFVIFPSCSTARSDSHPEGTLTGGHVKKAGKSQGKRSPRKIETSAISKVRGKS